MGSTTEIFMILNFMGALGGIATPIAIWCLCSIVKNGFDQHVSTMQLIYEELGKANRSVRP